MRSHFLLFLLPISSSAFVVMTSFTSKTKNSMIVLHEGEGDDNSKSDDGDKGLVLDGLDQEMRKVSSDNLFGAIDYLAEARKRAEQRTQSDNTGGGDDEWKQLANEKEEKYGSIDDWENSQKEAGNTDSQILLFTEPAPGEKGGDGDGEEGGDDPKLLLF